MVQYFSFLKENLIITSFQHFEQFPKPPWTPVHLFKFTFIHRASIFKHIRNALSAVAEGGSQTFSAILGKILNPAFSPLPKN